jgi:hypothetical protein
MTEKIKIYILKSIKSFKDDAIDFIHDISKVSITF